MENGKQPAFAVSKKICEVSKIEEYPYGLTKREYFAAMVMQAFASNHSWAKSVNLLDEWEDYKYRVVSGAIELADELLKQLEETK